ncbi:hypothetical protein [Streptomyces arenae]|uniref:hypothetical protein n=1 Tax=Streptomyces arenae TaxID=29301 RepID=UPI00265A3B53|nr:hypothetical protein [Streptomyces arenae]MCG7205338.1 hypothetical protein [Streptomyces arenae]
MMDAAALQRGWQTGLMWKAEDLAKAGQATHQISLDTSREASVVAENTIDQVRARFGAQIIGPATVFRRAS